MIDKRTILGAALAIGAMIPFARLAGAAPAADPATLERGQAHYLLFCANCHGVDADGKGPLVALLKVTPNDLRTLRQPGGPGVTERVLKAVDGRHPVAEGGHKMPVFSDNLEVHTVAEIAAYLDSIQQQP
jgi:mono/diheme cytochrome c family protein